MVVWQPFRSCWQLIIARVSEMHVAYHMLQFIVGYLFIGTKTKSNETKSRRPTSLHLTCIIVVGGEKQGGEKQGNASVRFVVVCREFCIHEYLFVVYCYCSSVWSFGSHFDVAGV
jgi:hypothetical protein